MARVPRDWALTGNSPKIIGDGVQLWPNPYPTARSVRVARRSQATIPVRASWARIIHHHAS